MFGSKKKFKRKLKENKLFLLDFGPKDTKARELVNARVCQEIIVFLN